jgi:myo-inositol-1-phosphate synthase
MPVKKGAEIAPAKESSGFCWSGSGCQYNVHRGRRSNQKGLADPIGSLTQMGTIRLGKRTDNRVPKIKTWCRWLI